MYKSILRKDLVQAVKFKNVTIEYQKLGNALVYYCIDDWVLGTLLV
jgi:hypothetical protein